MSDWSFEKYMLLKKLKRWRWGAAIFFVIALGLAFTVFKPKNPINAPHIATIDIKGVIQTDALLVKLINELKDDASVKAMVAVIDSPGGTTAGAEGLYEALINFAKSKPLITQIETLGASGGYIAALAGDHIIARQTSIVGSIGVLMQYPNVTKLMEILGVKLEEIKSSPLKASPNPFETATPEAKAAMSDMINGSFDWFKGLVQSRRQLSDSELKKVADGRVFTGSQALNLKLIDATGGDQQVLAYLKTKSLDLLPIKKHEPKKPNKPFLQSLVSETLGISPFTSKLEQQALDGLLVLWHP